MLARAQAVIQRLVNDQASILVWSAYPWLWTGDKYSWMDSRRSRWVSSLPQAPSRQTLEERLPPREPGEEDHAFAVRCLQERLLRIRCPAPAVQVAGAAAATLPAAAAMAAPSAGAAAAPVASLAGPPSAIAAAAAAASAAALAVSPTTTAAAPAVLLPAGGGFDYIEDRGLIPSVDEPGARRNGC